jgi:putative zinc finger/helix-turn-helix YgiT family protein
VTNCMECGTEMLRYIKPEHVEDLGGVVVCIRNAVLIERCPECGEEESAIPNMKGLVCAAALARALNPVRLSGKEIKFIRRALGMTQKEFSNKVEVTIETLSRWENDVPGRGGCAEKSLRYAVCALLHEHAPAIDFDPVTITNMEFLPAREIEPLQLQHGQVKMPARRRIEAWDFPIAA